MKTGFGIEPGHDERGDRRRLATRTLAALACVMQVTGADGQSPPPPPGSGVEERFDGAMRGWIGAHGIARASLAVMRDNRLVLAAGYGGRSANERVPMWSLSKAITALCTASLIKDGRLRLDDPIGPLLAPARPANAARHRRGGKLRAVQSFAHQK
jgi:CubicO group peptidase (beta-lactamase class C family)